MTPTLLPTEQYDTQLADKTARFYSMMARFNPPQATVFRSPPIHYRMRAEFRIWHDQDELYHIMFDTKTQQRLRVDQFPAASRLINQMMTSILDAIRPIPELRYKLFQIDYLSSQSDQIAVTLLYHRALGQQWQQQAAALRDRLRSDGFNVQIIGRAAKQKICLDQDYIDERLVVRGRDIIYRQVENSFTQPNAAINVNMLEWALDVTQGSEGDLLELYCGNGNFSLALASNFRRVLATEVAKSAVSAAQFNIVANQIDNVQIIRMSAEDFTQALQGVRLFNRLKGIDLADYDCKTILVDPPRSGLDVETLNLVKTYPNILYISCNPQTLCANLDTLINSHYISRLALFDQFPYTQHIECGVWLQQR